MPRKSLPASADIAHFRFQAEDLQRGREEGLSVVLQRIRAFHPEFATASDADILSAPFTRADAYLTVAREQGYSSWARLRRAVDLASGVSEDWSDHYRVVNASFRQAIEYLDDGNASGLRDQLRKHPQLVRERVSFEGESYFRHPSLLEFIAENPVRNSSLPPNIVEIAEVIILAGADNEAIDDALALVCSGRVARECGAQTPLVELLCSHGADADRAMISALAHGEFEAADALLRCGARLGIEVAAALGRMPEVRKVLAVSDAQSRHRALALAAQHGHAEIVTVLIEIGEDPNRYNPVGQHSHSTPLHQAALAGHEEVVKTLLEHGARPDMRDSFYNGTALEWAKYAKQDQVIDLLRGCE